MKIGNSWVVFLFIFTSEMSFARFDCTALNNLFKNKLEKDKVLTAGTINSYFMATSDDTGRAPIQFFTDSHRSVIIDLMLGDGDDLKLRNAINGDEILISQFRNWRMRTPNGTELTNYYQALDYVKQNPKKGSNILLDGDTLVGPFPGVIINTEEGFDVIGSNSEVISTNEFYQALNEGRILKADQKVPSTH